MKDIIITINGVLNNTKSLLDRVRLLPEKVVLLNSFIKSKYRLSVLNTDDRLTESEFKAIVKALPHVGLTTSIHKSLYSAKDLKEFRSTDYILVTSEPIFRSLHRVVFTNFEYGLQETDLIKISKT